MLGHKVAPVHPFLSVSLQQIVCVRTLGGDVLSSGGYVLNWGHFDLLPV